MVNNLNAFDTIKIICREFNRRDFNLSVFDTSLYKEDYIKFRGTKVPAFELINKPLGVVSFKFVPRRMELHIEISAKILGLRYFELININNIKDVIQKINSFGFVKLIPEDVIYFSECPSIHLAKNLLMSEAPNKYLSMLMTSQINPKFKSFNDKYLGVFYKAMAKSNGTVLKIYAKYDELISNKTKTNQILLTQIDADFYRLYLKPEGQFTNLKSIRKYLGMESDELVTLDKVLSAEVDGLVNLLETVFQNPDYSAFTSKEPGLRSDKEVKYYTFLYEKFGNDDSAVFAYLKILGGKTAYPEFKKYRAWKSEIGLTTSRSNIHLVEFFDKARAPFVIKP